MADRETHRRRYAKTAAKFAKLQALHDEGAPANDKRKLSDTWDKRTSHNVTGFHKPQGERRAKPAPQGMKTKHTPGAVRKAAA